MMDARGPLEVAVQKVREAVGIHAALADEAAQVERLDHLFDRRRARGRLGAPLAGVDVSRQAFDRRASRLVEVLSRPGVISNEHPSIIRSDGEHLVTNQALYVAFRAMICQWTTSTARSWQSCSAMLDRRKVGLGLTVFVELKIEGHSTKTATRLEKVFAAMEEVVACHIVSGPSNFLLEVVVEDLEVYEHFLLDTLLEVPGVNDVRSNISISTIKSNGPLPLRRNAGGTAARSRRRRA